MFRSPITWTRWIVRFIAVVFMALIAGAIWWVLPIRPHIEIAVGEECELLCLSADGQSLMTREVDYQEGTPSGPVRVWDTGTGRLRATFLSPASVVGQAVISSDGRRVALEHIDRPDTKLQPITLFDVTTQLPIATLPHTESDEEGEPDGQLVFSPNGKWLAVVRYDGKLQQMALRLLETSTGRVMATLPTRDREYIYCLVRFSPDGTSLAYTTAVKGQTTLRLYDLVTLRERAAFPGEYYPLAFSPDGQLWATAPAITGNPKAPLVISLRDLATGQVRWRFSVSDGFKLGAFYTPDEKSLLVLSDVGYGECQATVWDVSVGKVRSTSKVGGGLLKMGDDGSQSHALQYGPVILRAEKNTEDMRCWDPLTDQARPIPYNWAYLIFADNACTLARNGRTLAVEDWDTIQDNNWWHRIKDFLPNRIHPDGGSRHCVRLWDVNTGRDLGIFEKNSTFQFSPRGDAFALVKDGSLQIWDLPPRKSGVLFVSLLIIGLLTLLAIQWRYRRPSVRMTEFKAN